MIFGEFSGPDLRGEAGWDILVQTPPTAADVENGGNRMFADFFLAHLGRESLIAADDTWALLALVAASVALAFWL